MPSKTTEAGMAQGGPTAMPGTTAALEKMVVPEEGHGRKVEVS